LNGLFIIAIHNQLHLIEPDISDTRMEIQEYFSHKYEHEILQLKRLNNSDKVVIRMNEMLMIVCI